MESLRWQLFDAYGPRARIVRAERVRTGGVFGVGATTSYEVTVEVDETPAPMPFPLSDDGPRQPVRPAGGAGPAAGGALRRGIAALLAQADDADAAGGAVAARALPAVPAPDAAAAPLPSVSTQSAAFDAVLAGVVGRLGGAVEEAGETEPAEAAEAAEPEAERTAGPGDLIVLVGLRDQPLQVAWGMIAALEGGAELRTAGAHRQHGVPHVFIDSAEVAKARALAAVDGKPLVVAFSLGPHGSARPSALAAVPASRLWLVVDAVHKPEDTHAWVRQVAWHASPDALAVVGSAETATPESVNALGYPVGWVDGYPAASPTL